MVSKTSTMRLGSEINNMSSRFGIIHMCDRQMEPSALHNNIVAEHVRTAEEYVNAMRSRCGVPAIL